ncbi:MAG TPA: DUF1573 domain-containing protein [Bacteroidota bacterium]|nr:DUF1573 domain-containing protein [Bacteroidota bacterium]
MSAEILLLRKWYILPAMHNTNVAQRILFFAIVICLGITSSYGQAIRIEEGMAFDLGKIYEGRSVDRKLTIQNVGRDTLVINNVHTSCGCTVAKLSSDRILPGKREKLTVTIDSKDIQGDIKRDVYIASNDTASPKLDLVFRGTIITVVVVTPRYVNFGKAKIGQPVQRHVTLKNTVSDTIRVRTATSPDEQITIQLADSVIVPRQEFGMDILLSPKSKGNLLGQLQLTTDSRLKPTIKISFVGAIK